MRRNPVLTLALALGLARGSAACVARSVPPPPARTAAPAPVPPAPARPAAPPLAARLAAAADLAGQVVGASDAPATVLVVFASWCGHCHRALAMLDEVRAAHPRARVLGINYRGHEEYAQRGSPAALRAYVAEHAPWLRVVPADEALFGALGRPPKVPTVLVLDAAGALVERFDRRARPTPTADELSAVLRRLGA